MIYKIFSASSFEDLEKKVNDFTLKGNHSEKILSVSVGGILYLGGDYHQPVYMVTEKIIQPVTPNS